MANNQNLIPFGKNDPRANRTGRPKGSRNITTLLVEQLTKIAPDSLLNTDFIKHFCKGKRRVTVADAIAAHLLNEALINREPWAMKELLDRIEGKTRQAVHMTSGTEQTEPQARVVVYIPDNGRGDCEISPKHLWPIEKP